MSERSTELSYAVRLVVVAAYVGQLMIVLAALTIVPAVAAAVMGDWPMAWRLGVMVGAFAVVGASLARLPKPKRVQTNEVLVITAMMFLVTSLTMAWPMTTAGLGYDDAVFESVSAVTTTGLTTLRSTADRPPGFLFLRSWMQWYGGVGFIVLSLIVLTRPGMVAKQLAQSQVGEDDVIGGARFHARWIFTVYALLTAVGVIALLAFGTGLFNAMLYTFAAVSTGGFTPHDNSLAGLEGVGPGGAPAVIVTGLCLLGAISFVFYHRVWREGWRELVRSPQLLAIVFASVVATGVLLLCLVIGGAMAWQDAAWHAPMLAFSAQTTSGFSTMDPAELDNGSKLILIGSMLVGGEVGSTAGGFKVLRLLIVMHVLYVTLRCMAMPRHAVFNPQLAGHRLTDTEVRDAMLLVLMFVGVVALSWLPFVVAGYDPLDALFEVASATGTVGLSTGVTAPTLPTALKAVLCADMLMGRLEIMAWLVLAAPRTWLGRRRSMA